MCVYVETSAPIYLHITLMAVQAVQRLIILDILEPLAQTTGSCLSQLSILYAHCAVQTSQYPRVYSPSLTLSVSSSTLRSKLKSNQNNRRKSSELYKGVGRDRND